MSPKSKNPNPDSFLALKNNIRFLPIILALGLMCFYPACSSPVAGLSTAAECLKKGHSYSDEEQYELALKCYDRAVRLDPTNALCYFSRAGARSHRNDLRGAINDYTQAITLDPRDAAYYTFRGLSRRKMKDLDGAYADCLKAIGVDDSYRLAYWELGAIAEERKNYSEAVHFYTKAIEVEPKHKRVHILYSCRGIVERAQGNRDASKRDFLKALELKPDNGPTWSCYGNLELEMGNSNEAIHAYEKSLELDPKSNITVNNLGMAYLVAGRFDDAIEMFTKALEINPSYGLALTNRGIARFADRQRKLALLDFSKALQIDPDNENARLYSVLILRLQKTSDGVKGLKTLLTKSNDAWVKQIAGLLLGTVSKDEALKEASKGASYEIAARMCDVFYYSGMLHLIAGEATPAVESFKQCRTFNLFDYGESILAAAELKHLEQAAR